MGPFGPRPMPQRGSGPDIEVNDDEFLRAWTEYGGSEEKGRMHLNIAKTLGSSVAIGGKMYKPTQEDGDTDGTVTSEDADTTTGS